MNIGQLIAFLTVDTKGLDAAVIRMSEFEKSTTRSINTVSQRFRTFGYLATATLTVPMVAAGRASFRMARDYEYSIQKIVGLTGTAQSMVDEWSDSILKMGPELARKPQELADALYFIASSGIHGAEAMDVLKLSAKAATAGMGETQVMANVLTSALNAYRGTGLTAAYATDVLVAAVREGKAEATGFSTSLGQIIPIAAQLGVSFDQVAGGMAAITLTGASSANAAVYLKGVFNSLLTASAQGEQALNSVGTSYTELRRILSEQGLIALMQKLRDIQTKYGDELLSDVLPNIRALTGYLSIAGKNFQYNTELMQRVTNSTGSLGKAWAAVADTIKVRYDQAISLISVSLIKLGKDIAESLLPIIEKLASGLEKIANWYDGLTESQKRNKLMILAIIAALGPLTLALSILGYSISGAIAVFTKLFSVMTYGIAIVKALTGSMGGLRTAMNMNATLTKGLVKLLKNPYVLAAAAVGILIVAITRYSKKMKQLAYDQDSFNTTMIKVNGELMKMKELTTGDIGTMSAEEIQSAMETVRKEWDKAYKLYKQGLINKDEFTRFERFFGAMKNNNKFIQEQSDKIAKLKAQYDALGSAAEDLKKKKALEQQIAQEERLLALSEEMKRQMQEHLEVLSKYNDELKEQNKELERQSRLAFQAQEPIDYQKFFMRTSPYGAGTGESGFMQDLNKELAKSVFLNSLVGDSYDTLSGQVEVYKRAIEELYDTDLYRSGNKAAVGLMDQLVAKYKELYAQQKNLEDMEDSLQSLASVFSYLGGVIGGTFEKWVNWVEDLVRVMPDIIKIVKLITSAKKAETTEVVANTAAQAANAATMSTAIAASTGIALAQKAESSAEAGSAISGAVNAGAGLPFPYNIIAIESGVAAVMQALAMVPAAEAMVAKMANGGIVPAGYPNDSYPALLTSGERVVPPGKLEGDQTGGEFLIHVVGRSEIEADHIVITYDQRVRTKKKF